MTNSICYFSPSPSLWCFLVGLLWGMEMDQKTFANLIFGIFIPPLPRWLSLCLWRRFRGPKSAHHYCSRAHNWKMASSCWGFAGNGNVVTVIPLILAILFGGKNKLVEVKLLRSMTFFPLPYPHLEEHHFGREIFFCPAPPHTYIWALGKVN